MAKKLPERYRKSPESITSYTFGQTATGTGIVSYFCFASQGSSSVTYQMSEGSVYGQPKVTSGTGTTSTPFVLTNTYNFDNAVFKQGIIVRGVGYIQLTHGTQGFVGGGADSYLVISIVKVNSSGSETTLGSATTATVTSGAANAFRTSQIKIDLTTTNFTVGDKLRTKVEMYVGNVAGASSAGIFAHDANNGDIAVTTSTNPPAAFTINITASTNPTKFLALIPYAAVV